MEAQHLGEVYVINETAAGQEYIFLAAMLEEIQIMIKILQIAFTDALFFTWGRQVEQAVMTTGQIPILTGTKMIQHGTRLVREHNAHVQNPGIHHARQRKVNQTIPACKRHGFHSSLIRKFTN